MELVNCMKMTLQHLVCRVKIQIQLTEAFDVEKGFVQGDALSATLFHTALEKVIRNIETNPSGTNFTRTIHCMVNADNVFILDDR